MPEPRKVRGSAGVEVAAWAPPAIDYEVALAVRALREGAASDHQQLVALDWIITQAAGTYAASFRPGADGDRATAFAEGRRFVGLQIVGILNMPGETLKKLRSNENG